MSLKDQVKQALRICGHALGITIHDRLGGIEAPLQQLIEQNTHIASTQTALLQSGLHLVESAERVETAIREFHRAQRVRAVQEADLQEILNALAAMSDQWSHNQEFQVLQSKILQLQQRLEARHLQDSLTTEEKPTPLR